MSKYDYYYYFSAERMNFTFKTYVLHCAACSSTTYYQSNYRPDQ
jgi:hypothetical protein